MSNRRCNIWSNKYKDFFCMNCDELVMPGENTELNVCFTHWLVMCNKCCNQHEYHHKNCLYYELKLKEPELKEPENKNT